MALGLLLWMMATAAFAEDVPLTQDGGVWKVPVRIDNAVTLQFVVDSGAAEVCVPEDVVTTLVRAGTIHPEDMLDDSTGVLADGSKHRVHRVKLWQMEVGGQVLTDVPAMITPPSGVLLLGQSCLQRLPSWQLDTAHKVLHIGTTPPVAVVHPKPVGTPEEEPAAPPDSGDSWIWMAVVALVLIGGFLAWIILRPASAEVPSNHDDLGV